MKDRIYLALCLVAFLLSSCVTNKNVAYFQDLSTKERSKMDTISKFVEPVIQKDDVLSINVITADPQSVEVINQATTFQGMGTSRNIRAQENEGFPVDKNGDIELVMIGKIRVEGLTTYEAKELIRLKVSKDFKNPNVSVRFANFKVSVLGEVGKPASYTMASEKVNILDAISLAGDLTLYGKRDNVLIVREVDGKKVFGRVNLNSKSLFSSPFYYLKQNDVVYVEPTKAKVASLNNSTRTFVTVAVSLISTIIVIINRL